MVGCGLVAAYRDPRGGGIREMEWFVALLVVAIYAAALGLLGIVLWRLWTEVLAGIAL